MEQHLLDFDMVDGRRLEQLAKNPWKMFSLERRERRVRNKRRVESVRIVWTSEWENYHP